MRKINVGVIGATGYTGSEIVRILSQHRGVEIALITSESRAGEKFSDVHPFFQGIVDDVLVTAARLEEAENDDDGLDLVFLALPHGVSMDFVKRFAGHRFRIVDFSGDFRLASAEVYEQWYPKKHVYPGGFRDAVYGLPELFSDKIRDARLVANPGCFPTGAILSLAPLVHNGLIKQDGIIIDSKTGVTGAGIKASATNMFSNVNDNIKAYGLKKHRHTIEIQSILEELAQGRPDADSHEKSVPVQFTPHLLPVDRGILTTGYVRPNASGKKLLGIGAGTGDSVSAVAGSRTEQVKSALHVEAAGKARLQRLYLEYYRNMPFVRITEQPPTLKDVRASNYCNIYIDYDERTGNIIVISAIDNLVKGAAGLAVQNMNVMFGFDEMEGLAHIPISP